MRTQQFLIQLRQFVGTLRNPEFPPVPIFIRSVFLHRLLFNPMTLILQAVSGRKAHRINRPEFAANDFKARMYEYNLETLRQKVFIANRRSDKLYAIARVLVPNIEYSSILILGPLTINEILIAWLHGFSWKKIRAVDFICSHKKIELGDIENLPVLDKFDVVCASAVFSCVENMEDVFSSISRNIKVGGILIFQACFSPGEIEFPSERISRSDFMNMLGIHGFEVLLFDNDRVSWKSGLMFFGAKKL